MAAPLSRALLRGAGRGLRPWGNRGLSEPAAAASASSRWKLFGGLCLQRPPTVSQAPSPEEVEMAELFQQLEVEKSIYSTHEMTRLAENERLRRIAEKGYDEEEERGDLGKEVVLIRDLEDMWEQNFQQFSPAPRITDADKNNDRTSLNRKLDQNLLLLVKHNFGDQTVWLLPQTEWEAGETLRETAERGLATLSGNPLQAKFLGNAPCGFYKYKFPKALRAEGFLGGKVFFFKAFLQGSHWPLAREKVDYVWVSKEELADYLTPAYHSQVSRFLVDL
nr:39S ribosomal protein L46, mitochondrial [Pogona vitticeps]